MADQFTHQPSAGACPELDPSFCVCRRAADGSRADGRGENHLSTCEDCYFVFTESLRTKAVAPDAERRTDVAKKVDDAGRPAPTQRRWRWWYNRRRAVDASVSNRQVSRTGGLSWPPRATSSRG